MSRSQSAGQQLSVNDLHVVMEELNDIRAKWDDIGLQLHVSVGTLDAIKEQYDDPSRCLRETLKTWLKTCPSSPTWKNIVDALRSSTVGEVRLAADLEQKYCSTQDTSVAATHHHALPAPPSQTDTQTTPLQQSQSQAHVTLAPPVSPSQALTLTTPPTQYTIPPMQPPVLAYSGTRPSHPPPWSTPFYYSPHIGYPLSTPFTLTPPPPGVATASVHPSYSQVPQVTITSQLTAPRLPTALPPSLPTPFSLTPPPSGVATASVHPLYSQVPQVIPTSSRPLLPSVPAQPTAPQFPTTLSQYPSPPSLTTIPPDTSSIHPLATVTTPPDRPPVAARTLGKKADTFGTMFHLKSITIIPVHCYMHSNTTWL